MNRLRTLRSILQLTRVTLVLTAVSHVWLSIFLALEVEPDWRRNPNLEQLPLPWLLVLGAVLGGGLYGYATALNDVLDVRRDRLLRPDRPIPSGGVGRQTAMVVAVICLLLALLAATFFGRATMVLTVATAGGLLFYNAVAKHLPATGLITVMLCRMLLFFTVNPLLGFAWPAVLAMTHEAFWLRVAYRMDGSRKRWTDQDWLLFTVGWAFWALAVVAWIGVRDGMAIEAAATIWIGPILVMAWFLVAARLALRPRRHEKREDRPRGRRLRELIWISLMVFDAAWLISAGLIWQGLLCAALPAVAVAMAWLLGPWKVRPPGRFSDYE